MRGAAEERVSPTVVAATSESDIDVDDGQASEEAAEVQEQWVLFYEFTDERGDWWRPSRR